MWRKADLSTWRHQILKDILDAQAKLVIAVDPDGLLSDEKIQQEVREHGFDFMIYNDPAVFRNDYESKYRSKWDLGQNTEARVLLRLADGNSDNLPFDLIQAGCIVVLRLGDLFPKLSYPVIEKLPAEQLDTLFEVYQEAKPAMMGDNETCDFTLHYIFHISAELIKEPEDLLKTLLRIHFGKEYLPPVLTERLVLLLQQKPSFKSWPLKTLFSDRHAFFQFLQERWPLFLNRLAAKNAFSYESGTDYKFKIEGPRDIPFEHRDVHIYLDNMFLEGLLQPVKHEAAGKLAKTYKWARAGLITGAHTEDVHNLETFLENLEGALPSAETRYHDWLNFADRWAHFNVMRQATFGSCGPELSMKIDEYQLKIDLAFDRWLGERYAGLYNMPATPPLMQHQIPRSLAELCLDKGYRVALLVLDGMSFDQWLVIKNVLLQKNPSYKFHETGLFAWAPTITSVCRQALFSGKIPISFASSIMTTEKEPVLWSQFWFQQGLSRDASAYIKGLGEPGTLTAVEEISSSHKVRALGLVADKLDKIMHGIELGAASMHSQVKQWAMGDYLGKLLGILQRNRFQIYLTSDHGNIEAKGCGRPMEGAIADIRGERVRIYKDTKLRSAVAGKFPGSVEWPSIGLPDNFLPLFAPGRKAFIPEGHTTVTHGGASIEEIIVPLVRIDWRTD
jgi:hypothetical protein